MRFLHTIVQEGAPIRLSGSPQTFDAQERGISEFEAVGVMRRQTKMAEVPS